MSTVNAAPAEKKSAGLLATLANNSKQYGIVGALVVIVLVFEFLTKGVLLKPNSFVSLIQQNAYVIILAIGMVMVIIAVLALMLKEGYLVDICLIYAMISFLAVVVLSKVYIGIYEEKHHQKESHINDTIKEEMSDGNP